MRRLLARHVSCARGVTRVSAWLEGSGVTSASFTSGALLSACMRRHGVPDGAVVPAMLHPPCTAAGAMRAVATAPSGAVSAPDTSATVPWSDEVCTRIAAGLEARYGAGPAGVDKALRSNDFEAVLSEKLVLVSGISVLYKFNHAYGRHEPAAFIDVLKDEKFQRGVHALSEKPRTFVHRLQSQAKPDSVLFPLYAEVPVMVLAPGDAAESRGDKDARTAAAKDSDSQKNGVTRDEQEPTAAEDADSEKNGVARDEQEATAAEDADSEKHGVARDEKEPTAAEDADSEKNGVARDEQEPTAAEDADSEKRGVARDEQEATAAEDADSQKNGVARDEKEPTAAEDADSGSSRIVKKLQLMVRKVSPAEFDKADTAHGDTRVSFKQMPVELETSPMPTVVTGSSGSGKTDFMIAGGPNSPAAVLYMRAGEFKNALKAANGTNDRDDKFVSHLSFMLDFAMPKLFLDKVTAAKVVFGPDEASTVRVVVDEAGSGSDAARALIRQSEAVRKLVATKLSVNESKVYIFVGGTGSASPDTPWGSEPSAYEIVNMDIVGMKFSEHFRAALPGAMREYLQRATASAAAWEYRAMLSNPRLAALLVNHASSLAKYRLRAEVAKYPLIACGDGGRLEQAGVTMGISVSARATLSALDAMTGFFLLNGLGGLVRVGNHVARTADPLLQMPGIGGLVTVLARALAIDVGCYDGIADSHTQQQLLTKFGVLQDRAEEVDTVKPGYRRVHCARHAAHQSDVAAKKKKVLVVPLDCRGRFVMAPAYRAMLLRLWFGDAAVELREADAVGQWERLERHAWRWAAVLTACVTAERSLEDLVVLSSVGRLHSAKDRSRLLKPGAAGEDCMASYRGAVFTDLKVEPTATMERCVVAAGGSGQRPTAEHGVHAATAEVQRQGPLPDLCPMGKDSMDLSRVQHGVALVELRRAMPYTTNENVDKAFMPSLLADPVTRPLGVAMLNAPRAPFADVVAHVFDPCDVKPSETVLVQVKRYETNDAKLDDEVAKIGALTKNETKEVATANINALTDVEFATIQALTDDEIALITALTDDGIKKIKALTKRWIAKIKALTDDEIKKIKVLTDDEITESRALTTRGIAKIKALTDDEIAKIKALTDDEILVIKSLTYDEVKTIKPLTKRGIAKIKALTDGEIEDIKALTAVKRQGLQAKMRPEQTKQTVLLQKREIVKREVEKLCHNHGLFVAIVAADRLPTEISDERAAAAETLLPSARRAAPDVKAPPPGPRAAVLHLKTAPNGGWVATSATDQQWTRPPLFPLILGDQDF